MKDFYFPHSISAAGDDKILKLRVKLGNAEAYGMWWMLLEHLARNDGYINGDGMAELSISYGISHEKWKVFLEFCEEISLLRRGKNGLFSHRMNEHLGFRKERSESGKKGAISRWGSQDKDMAQPLPQPMAQPMAGKERKGKEIKEIKKLGKNDGGTEATKPTDPAPKQRVITDDEAREKFRAVASDVFDPEYAEKIILNMSGLNQAVREEIYRKIRVCINSYYSNAERTKNLGVKICREIAGKVNDGQFSSHESKPHPDANVSDSDNWE